MIKSNLDILVEVDFSGDTPIIWHYFRGCPEIRVHIRPWNDVTVFIEHKQKDSRDDWTEEHDGPELYVEDSTLYDMVSAGVADGLIGKGYAGAEAIWITELPESSQDFVLNTLNLKDYVKWDE